MYTLYQKENKSLRITATTTVDRVFGVHGDDCVACVYLFYKSLFRTVCPNETKKKKTPENPKNEKKKKLMKKKKNKIFF